MKCVFIVWNKKSGPFQDTEEIEHQIHLLKDYFSVLSFNIADVVDQERFAAHIESHKPDMLVAIGGDGTVNACAQIATKHSLKLGIIPTGTFNHFAKHLHIPHGVKDAFSLLRDGQTEFIDTGCINGHVFVNFISLGFYANTIFQRVKGERAGVNKWISFTFAVIKTLIKYDKLTLYYEAAHGKFKKTTPLLFIGNNRIRFGSYDMLAERESFTDDQIHVWMSRAKNRFHLILTFFFGLFMDLHNKNIATTLSLKSVNIDTPHKHTPISVDGEVLDIKAPYHIQTMPRALPVIVQVDFAS